MFIVVIDLIDNVKYSVIRNQKYVYVEKDTELFPHAVSTHGPFLSPSVPFPSFLPQAILLHRPASSCLITPPPPFLLWQYFSNFFSWYLSIPPSSASLLLRSSFSFNQNHSTPLPYRTSLLLHFFESSTFPVRVSKLLRAPSL